MNIEKYRKDAEEFLSQVDKEYYLHFSGRKQNLDLSTIYTRFKYLFGTGSIDYLKDLKDKSSGEEAKKATYLLKFCTRGFMEEQVKDLMDKIAGDEASAKIEIEGEKIPFRFSEILMANEGDKAKRDLIEDRRNEKVASVFNGTLEAYWGKLHQLAKDLGFKSYRDLFSYLKEEDFTELESGMEELLESTDELYREHVGKLLEEELGLKFEQSRRSDFAYLKRAKKYDRYFKKEGLVPIFTDTLSGMGIDISKLKNIYFDIEERENKSPRAFCSTVRVPQEIYLVVMPGGGQDDYEAMLHEGGHTLHFASTNPKLDFEYRYLGDNAVTEGFAFVLEQLMQNPAWISDFLGMDNQEARQFVYFSNLVKLWFCRRYAGKLKYELILHDGGSVSGREASYKEILSSANLMEYSEVDYLRDVDEGFYCTNYIRAWVFQSQLRDHMEEKFGYQWYRKKKAGLFLRELWDLGQKYPAAEILSQLGFKGLDINYLIDSLTRGIKSF